MEQSPPPAPPTPPLAVAPPARSVSHILIELLIVTGGVFIALSVDSLREWNQSRVLVREAREMLAREIRDNKREVDNTLASVDQERRNFANALQFANDLIAHGKTDVNEIKLTSDMAEFSSASWQSAERTGALAHMDYAEVQKYARLYTFQELYAAHQRRGVERLAEASALLSGGDPQRAGGKDVEAFRQQVLALMGALQVKEQLGRRLSELYTTTLEP